MLKNSLCKNTFKHKIFCCSISEQFVHYHFKGSIKNLYSLNNLSFLKQNKHVCSSNAYTCYCTVGHLYFSLEGSNSFTDIRMKGEKVT